MNIKDIFKGAATAAVAFGVGKLLPEPIAKPVSTAISKAFFSPSGKLITIWNGNLSSWFSKKWSYKTDNNRPWKNIIRVGL